MERKLKGFTIIELLVVLTIITVLCSIGVPAALTWVRDAKIRDANEEARLVYSAVQDYLTELEIKNIDVKASGASTGEMLMHSCSTSPDLPEPISGASRDQIAEFGVITDLDANGIIKDVGIDLSGALGTEFEGVWAVKFNTDTYTVIESYWTPYINGSDPSNPPTQTKVTVAEAFENGTAQESYYNENGVIIGKFPL